MCGGLGRCGREICCSLFMDKFGPVSIRMAKEQSLSLNPTKISGQCGRLMCCLTFEHGIFPALPGDKSIEGEPAGDECISVEEMEIPPEEDYEKVVLNNHTE